MTTQTVYEHRLTERAGSQAKATERHGSGLLPFQGQAEVSPARLQGVLAGTPAGASCCSFCPRSAAVTYRHGAGLLITFCGAHAVEVLGTQPAEMLRALEGQG